MWQKSNGISTDDIPNKITAFHWNVSNKKLQEEMRRHIYRWDAKERMFVVKNRWLAE